ncbi:MAG: ribosome maturation factor RimM [Christensenellaceae bacterium]|jgi:16S rRNA processing protein RimM
MTDYFELGRVLKPQGIRGEVKIQAYTDNLERFDYLEYVFRRQNGGYSRVDVEHARADAQFAYLKLAGISTRDDAEALRGEYLFVDRAHAAKLPEGAFYICDIVGLPVFVEGEGEVGKVAEILQTGTKDVYVVSLKEGGKLMFPSVPEVFAKKDIPGGKIVLEKNKLMEIAVYDV